MHDLGMFGKPIYDPKNAVFLRPHRRYAIETNGNRGAIQCCYGSKRAAPMVIELTLTNSSCVEHPVQRLLLAIADHLDPCIYGVDASDAFMHSPGPYVPALVSIVLSTL